MTGILGKLALHSICPGMKHQLHKREKRLTTVEKAGKKMAENVEKLEQRVNKGSKMQTKMTDEVDKTISQS